MNLAIPENLSSCRLRIDPVMTDDELARFCAENDPIRVERDSNGDLILMSPSFSDGGSTELAVGTELMIWTRQDGRGKAFGPNSGFTLPDNSLRAADAAWVSWVRWNALQGKQYRSFSPICPEFVIEVRSATDRLTVLREKMEMWISNGAELAWLLDPERRAVEIYRPGESPEVHQDPSSVQGDGPVRGFEMVLSTIW